jgi:integrase
VPATQQGQTYRLGPRNYGIRYYGPDGVRTRKSGFTSASRARGWFREVVEPRLRGEVAQRPDVTFGALVDVYLERHSAQVRPRTIATLSERLAHAVRAFGAVPLRELAGMVDELSAWQAAQPAGIRYGRSAALRQCLEAGVRWGYLPRNPAKLAGRNRQPAPRPIRVFTPAELRALSLELSAGYRPVPSFCAATGLRPEEWMALERRDVDRGGGVLNVRRTVSCGEVVELGKTSRSLRQVPLSPGALAALDALPPRVDTPLLFPAPSGGLLHTNNFRSREWAPAVEAAAVARPARVYDLRSTFASNALAAGVSAFELARIMGTSVAMIDRTYGSLLDGAVAGLAVRLGAAGF